MDPPSGKVTASAVIAAALGQLAPEIRHLYKPTAFWCNFDLSAYGTSFKTCPGVGDCLAIDPTTGLHNSFDDTPLEERFAIPDRLADAIAIGLCQFFTETADALGLRIEALDKTHAPTGQWMARSPSWAALDAYPKRWAFSRSQGRSDKALHEAVENHRGCIFCQFCLKSGCLNLTR